MSIRPVNLEEFTETSFEDIDTTISPTNWKKDKSQRSSPLRETAAVPSSASSESTTFSNSKQRYSTHTESDEDGNAFLDDFEEFHGKARDDDIIRSHFAGPNRKATKFEARSETETEDEAYDEDLEGLTSRFGDKFDIKTRNLTGVRRPLSASRAFRQPQSMLELRESTTDSRPQTKLACS